MAPRKDPPEDNSKAGDTAPRITFAQTGRERGKSVPLEWPLTIDGVELTEINLRRLTAGEVAGLQERLETGDGSNEAMIAEFADQPIAVLSALDQDDIATLGDAVWDFLPRRLREGIEEAAEMERSRLGAPSSQTSPTPSNGAEPSS